MKDISLTIETRQLLSPLTVSNLAHTFLTNLSGNSQRRQPLLRDDFDAYLLPSLDHYFYLALKMNKLNSTAPSPSTFTVPQPAPEETTLGQLDQLQGDPLKLVGEKLALTDLFALKSANRTRRSLLQDQYKPLLRLREKIDQADLSSDHDGKLTQAIAKEIQQIKSALQQKPL